MHLAVTERAAVALEDLWYRQGPEHKQVLRLDSDAEGLCLFTLGTKNDRDRVATYKGRIVLVIEPSVADDLSGCILDWKQTAGGRSFTFA
jgi:Fe-S cluster assembly iron-binding protein IscA